MNQKKTIIFFSAGLGDAVLLVPLMKALKADNYRVHGLFNSPHPCQEIFGKTSLLDEIIIVKSKQELVSFALKNRSHYHLAFINYFSSNPSNLLAATILARQVIYNKNVNFWFLAPFNHKIKFVDPISNIHDSEQNLHLYKPGKHVKLTDIQIPFTPSPANLPQPYFVVQISAGNNQTPYKNWPVPHWIEFLKSLQKKYTSVHIVLLGDNNEINLASKIQTELNSSVTSLVGKTSVEEAMNVLFHCRLFIGLDGGLMHLAAALNKPTFTLWGGSNKTLYGYENMNALLHKCLGLNLACSPCNAWINPNTSKTTNPLLCPDFACMQALHSEYVFSQFEQFINSLPAND